MSVWVLIIMVVLKNGQVYAVTQTANDPQYNNKSSCETAGQLKADQEQLKVGLDNGTTYFKCDEITADQIRAATAGGNKQDGSTF